MKKEIEPEFLWHLDKVVLTFQTTIVTTIDKDGKINAAPFGLVYPFCTGSGTPQMLIGVNSRWHTARNIESTGEFVINYASYSLMEQVATTGLMYDEGVNELEKAGLTAIPSLKVKPPRIKECYQCFECRLCRILRPNDAQMNFIGDITAITVDEELLNKTKEQAAKAADPLLLLGMEIQSFTGYYARIDQTKSFTPPEINV